MTEEDRQLILDAIAKKRRTIKTKAQAIAELKKMGYLTPSGRVSIRFNRR